MKMTQIKVRNMQSPQGNDVPNQFIIYTDKGRYFQSYQSVIAYKPNGRCISEHLGLMTCTHNPKETGYCDNCCPFHTVLDKNTWDYSRTTGKYRNIFLNESKKDTEAKIKSGEYKLANLN
jgi:hypothetical protein